MVTLVRDDGRTICYHQRRCELYYAASIGVAEYCGHTAPLDKRVYPCRSMVLIGFCIDLDAALRSLSAEKCVRYGTQLTEMLSSGGQLRGGVRHVARDEFNRLVHRLLHASEVIPLGRSHLFYSLQALRDVNRLHGDEVILSLKVQQELAWWDASLADAASFALPLASRRDFPTASQDGVLVHYGDASREYDESTGVMSADSGFGSWCVIDEVFYYLEGRWTTAECAAFSINVLEFATEQMGTFTFAELARSLDASVTHVHAFTDNTTAEHVSEGGRTQREGLNQLNQRRLHELVEQGLHQQTSRVPSVFNDVADLLSRGDVEEALRFPRDAGLRVVRVPPLPRWRDLSAVSPTWA